VSYKLLDALHEQV